MFLRDDVVSRSIWMLTMKNFYVCLHLRTIVLHVQVVLLVENWGDSTLSNEKFFYVWTNCDWCLEPGISVSLVYHPLTMQMGIPSLKYSKFSPQRTQFITEVSPLRPAPGPSDGCRGNGIPSFTRVNLLLKSISITVWFIVWSFWRNPSPRDRGIHEKLMK